jgi:hypothetical protein
VSARVNVLRGGGEDVPFTVGHSDGNVLASSGMDMVNPELRGGFRLVSPGSKV